jgi:O-antigen ligase
MSISEAPVVIADREPAAAPMPVERRAQPSLRSIAALCVVAIAAAYFATVTHSGILILGVCLAIPVAAALVFTALWRFEWFLLGLLAVRATLDVFANPDGQGIVSLGVTGALGIFGALWLIAQKASGEWVRTSIATRSLMWFGAACVLSSLGSKSPATSLLSTVKFASGVLMFAVLEQYLGRNPRAVKRVVYALLISLIVPVVLGLQQSLSSAGNAYYADVSRVQGSFVHPTPFSEYLVSLILLFVPLSMIVQNWLKWVLRIALVACIALEILTYTRTGWIAVVAALLYLGFKQYRKLLAGMIIALVVLILAVPSVISRFSDLSSQPVAQGVPANSFAWRINYWEQVAPLANKNPVTGIGFDMVQHTTAIGLQPHNIYVETYTETGVIGCLALLGVILAFAKTLRQRLRAAVTARNRGLALSAMAVGLAFLIMGLGENLLVQPVIFWYVAAAMTFGCGRAEELARTAKSRQLAAARAAGVNLSPYRAAWSRGRLANR